ncbi:hypothetical protein [Trichloromonas sp.]|uniref:hypothetical protein n=1 Tax=Trichloromonas sp. TaxID=3069249 RepID=UPI002A38EBFA|nr:hypothetical protein [Trichloromonas sp.]
MISDQAMHLTNLLSFAFFANLPLGYLRESTRKYSLRWFVYIHISIPFILAMRISYEFGWEAVPFTLVSAVAGQMLGGRIKRGRRP